MTGERFSSPAELVIVILAHVPNIDFRERSLTRKGPRLKLELGCEEEVFRRSLGSMAGFSREVPFSGLLDVRIEFCSKSSSSAPLTKKGNEPTMIQLAPASQIIVDELARHKVIDSASSVVKLSASKFTGNRAALLIEIRQMKRGGHLEHWMG